MLRTLFIYLLLTILSGADAGWGQTNLICNPSFEEYNQEVFDKLNQGEGFYASHFKHSATDGDGLFSCWYWGPGEGAFGTTLNNATGITLGIIPNLFPVTNYVPGQWEPSNYIQGLYAIDPDYSTDPPCVYRSLAAGHSRINLVQSPQDPTLFGLDLSPPNTKFGEGVNAVDGTNYVALMDFENMEHAKPYIYTELKYPLVEGVEYTFTMWFAKMNLLGTIKTEDEWDAVRDGHIRVFVCNDNFNQKQRIFNQEITSHDWNYNEGQVNFVADHNSTRLYIEFDPFHEQLLDPNYVEKIAGVFIDHLKLYESCEDPENQCVNANYRRDMLDVKLETVEMESPNAYPDNEGFDDGFFQTVRAYHLENVKRFEMKIFPILSSDPIRVIDMYYPHSDYFWDGKDQFGNPVPGDAWYRAEINAVSNDCFHNSYVDEKEFILQRHYSVFNVSVSTNAEDGNSFINGLDNVHWVNVKMYTMGGSLVHEFSLNNPPSSLGLSIPSLENFGGAQNGAVAPAYYKLVVTVSNNCSEVQFDIPSSNWGSISDSGTPSPFYNWSPVTKPSEFGCPFDFHYDQNVLSPMNCCEGYLHLENMEVWNSWGEVNIQDSILIGPNVVFEPDTYNYLNSGGQIQLLPDSSGVTVLGTAVFKPSTFECEICKNYTFESVPDDEYTASDREIVYANMDSLATMRSKKMIVYPNPSSGNQEITLLAGTVDIDPMNYKLVLSNSLGKPVEIKVTAERRDLLRFKPKSGLSPGAYYLYFESNEKQETFSVVIR